MNEQEQDENSERLKIGRMILMAIAEHEEFYDEYICKYTQYPDEEEDKYHDGTANYDDDVDIAEMNAVIDILSYVVTNHHPHKVVYEVTNKMTKAYHHPHKVVTTEGGEE